ncbi:MAG: hypothetical protein JNK27_04865 [Chitinophagaceae bacterium]|nr:hypothetical protein [Chitinophagaceae bacterium]
MDSNIILSVVAILISIGGFIIALLAHKRNRRFDNENHIYKLKIEACRNILNETTQVLDLIDNAWHYANSIKEKATDEEKEALEQMADNVDAKVILFTSIIAANSLVLPTTLVSMLDNFSEYLLKSDIENNSLKTEDEIINECHKKADRILSEMRKDLNIDTLNVLLFNRIKK